MRRAGRVPRGYAAIGDDVASVPPGKGRLVVKVDMLVEHTDVPPGMTYRQAARKAAAMCVSDFAAKGVKPDSFMVSLGLRRGVTQEQVDALAAGFRDAEREWKVHLVGGDTNESEELIIDCAMLGFARRIVPRSGSSPGDALMVTGRFGYTRAGLGILTKSAAAEAPFRKKATESVLMPTPNLRAGIALAPYLTSAMDSSDGLARSLHTLAKASGVGFELTSLPAADGVKEFASSNGLDPDVLVLQGGEEYVMVGTLRRRELGAARRAAKRAGGELLEIGRATRSGKVELLAGGKRRMVEDEGWTHLR
ncbi:MAG: thiamine-phosphate kinase [Nitrososphaerota archaeon]|nr:thiamine-phosphate kinase [Nitrososphaerota archaeon]MDG7024046.1 thiamine-phosphate kinase [Nitrososphaerota archaeon]